MAKILKSFDFKATTRGSKHPWEEWLDGQIRELTPEDWGNAKPNTIRMMARSRAKKLGKKVRIAVNKETGGLVLQAYTPEPGDQAEPSEQKESAKTRKGKKQIQPG